MSDPQGDAMRVGISAALAGFTGFIGMLVGVKVQGSEIANIKERLDRIEGKVDRLIEREMR